MAAGRYYYRLFTAWAVPRFGWRFGYLAAGTVSSAMLVAVYFTCRNRCSFSPPSSQGMRAEDQGIA